MGVSADFYFSMRSPYSYLGVRRLERLMPASKMPVSLELKPVLPIAVRIPDVFKRVGTRGVRYLEMDTRRIAEQMGIDYRVWPIPDPIDQDMETLQIASEQPRIFALVRMVQVAIEQGAGLDFLVDLFTLIWDGKTDDWDQGAHIAGIVERHGLDYEQLLAVVAAEAERLDNVLFANQDRLVETGHHGVPSLVVDGEPFFGQDRMELFFWRINQASHS